MTDDIARILTITALALLGGCGEGSGRSKGEVDIAIAVAPADNCPDIKSAVAAPAQTSVGGSIGVAITATDPDPGDKLSYSWAPADGFESPQSATTTYTCKAVGRQTMTVTVTDGHAPTPCSAGATLTVECVAP